MIEIKFKKLSENAIIPSYAHDGDVGLDLTATWVEYNAKEDEYIYGTGLACETEQIISMFAHPRSSIHKTDFYLTNSVGIIDCKTYRGEIKVIFKYRDSLTQRITASAMEMYDNLPWYKKLKPGSFKNIKDKLLKEFHNNPFKNIPYRVGDRVCQIWLQEITPVHITEVNELSNTERGEGGFGSTGK